MALIAIVVILYVVSKVFDALEVLRIFRLDSVNDSFYHTPDFIEGPEAFRA